MIAALLHLDEARVWPSKPSNRWLASSAHLHDVWVAYVDSALWRRPVASGRAQLLSRIASPVPISGMAAKARGVVLRGGSR